MKGILASLLIKLGLDSKEYENGIDKAKKSTNQFGEYFKKIGGLIAGAFAVDRIIAFGKELINLSGITEGVSKAFFRMATQFDLDKLKEATKGTVSELDLMKRAVQAQNLGLPIKNLSSLFEFATKRAQETGQSVDYLVDSIVLGIGRKSPLILDNLGISAIALKAKLKGVGMETATVADIAKAVGEIAADSMKASGEIIDTNAIKIQRLSALWADFKKGLAEAPEFNKALGEGLDKINRQIRLLPQGLETSWKALKFVFGNRLWEQQPTAIFEDEPAKKGIKTWGEFMKIMEAYGYKKKEIIELTQEQKDAIEAEVKAMKELSEKTRKALIPEKEDEIDVNKYNAQAIELAEQEKQLLEKRKIEKEKFTNFLAADAEEQERIAIENAEKIKAADELKAENFKQFKQDFAYLVQDFGIEVVDQLGAAFGELIATGDFPADFGKNMLSIIGGFISTLGKMLLTMGLAAIGFQKLLESAFTSAPAAALAIAGGLALIAAGAAFQGAAKAGPKGSGSSGGGGGYSVTSQPYSNASMAATKNTGQAGVIELNAVLKGDSIFLSNQRNTYKRNVIG